MDSREMKNCKKREKTVSRAYGGSRCHTCVRQRWVLIDVMCVNNRNRVVFSEGLEL